MLKLKDLVENFDLAKEALQHWQYDAETLDDCLQYFRISSNAIYPFHQNGRLCFLRLAPVGEKLLTNLQGELEFILYLRENNYPALEPLQAKEGEYILTLTTQWGDYYATAFYAVEGEPIEDTDFSEDVCLAYGKALGRMHQLSSPFVPTVRKQSHEALLELMEKRLTDFRCEKALFDCLAELRRVLSDLPKDAAHYGLLHYDFECDNVFYDEDTGTCNVIDFDDGIYHFYALDVEQAVDSIYEEAPEELAENAVKAFLSGYQSEFSYDGDEQVRSVMRRFCDLYSYTKLLYCLSESVEDEPDWMVELKEKLSRKAAYLKRKLCDTNSCS